MARPRVSFTKIWALFPQLGQLIEDGVVAIGDGKVDEEEQKRILADFWALVEAVRKK